MNRLLDHGKNWCDLRVCGGIFSQTLRRPKHLIRIPAHPGPPERADLIDDLRRVSSPRSQIPAMDNGVRCNLPQVRDNGLQGAPIAVNIRYDRDSHFVVAAFPIIARRRPLQFYNGPPKRIENQPAKPV